jgi:hypothetical protein
LKDTLYNLKETWNLLELSNSVVKEFHDDGPDGLKIYKIDGNQVRNTLDVEFIGGGHNLVYPFIPENEIWIETLEGADDQRFILAHELVEIFLMRHLGWPYKKAHNVANKTEDKLRHGGDPEVVFDEFCKEYFKKPSLENAGKQLALAYLSY